MTVKVSFKNHVKCFLKQNIVVKTNMMWPFCVRGHFNICSNALVPSITIDARKKLITPKLPLLSMATENGFGHHKIID